MKNIFKADTLDEAYRKVSQSIDTPIAQLDIEVIQAPSEGILGLMKKEAIVEVKLPNKDTKISQPLVEKKTTNAAPDIENKLEDTNINDEVIKDIYQKLDGLLSVYCLDIKIDKLHKKNENTIYIKLIGEDAKILIGTKGYRYDAMSVLLHSWIKRRYNKELQLEVLEYLENKKQKVKLLLEKFMEDIEQFGTATSVEMSGQYLRIAIDLIQTAYPDKRIILKETRMRRKTITIDDRLDEL